jgi:hypothetical protein
MHAWTVGKVKMIPPSISAAAPNMSETKNEYGPLVFLLSS